METFVRSRGAPPVLSSSTTSTPSFSFSHTCTRACVCAHALRFFLPCPSPLATPLLLLLLLRFFSLRAQCRHICIFIRECNRRARFSPLVARYRGKNSRKMAERFEADMRSDFLRSPPPSRTDTFERTTTYHHQPPRILCRRNDPFFAPLSSSLFFEKKAAFSLLLPKATRSNRYENGQRQGDGRSS